MISVRSIIGLNVYLEDRKKLIKTYVWSVTLYDFEAWTISKGGRRRLEALEMWYYRKLLKISWVDKATNEEVLDLVKEKILYASIKRSRDKLIGHTDMRDWQEKIGKVR